MSKGSIFIYHLFGGSMKHVELVDVHRKDSAMVQHSDPSVEARGWDIPVDTRNNWLYGILSGADFVMLQTFLPAGSKDVALTISLLALAVALPMNILLVLLTYAKKKLPDKVRLFCLTFPAIACTFIGIDAAFWHASWYLGVVFTVAMAIISAVALYTYHE